MTVEGIARKLVAAVVIGLSLAWVVWTVGGLNFSDADAYRLAADRLVSGQDIYVEAPNQDEAFRYAPWFAVVWIPLAALPELVGDLIWAALLGFATVFCVIPLARQPYLSARLLAVFGGSMLIWTVARGNVHPLVMVALIQGLDRRLGPLWVALAASLKAVPIFFVLVYIARREWGRAVATLAITGLLVLPMPLMGWEAGTVDPGESLSLYYLVSPPAWAIVATAAGAVALVIGLRRSKYVALASAVAAILALPRLLLYDITYVMVQAEQERSPQSSTRKRRAVLLDAVRQLVCQSHTRYRLSRRQEPLSHSTSRRREIPLRFWPINRRPVVPPSISAGAPHTVLVNRIQAPHNR